MPSAGAQPGEEGRSVGDGSGEDTSGDAAPGVPGAVAALCLIQFIDVLGVTVVVTALPDMLADVGGSSGDGALGATGYALVFRGLLISDLRPRRSPPLPRTLVLPNLHKPPPTNTTPLPNPFTTQNSSPTFLSP